MSLSDVVKFTALASTLAIFIDAAIAHAMFWGNDPYWTYWVTDTLLMATVFGLGTMLFGIGIGRGALITAVHVTLLTIYYWSLSPIGLPSQPEWLDLERTWITGLPVHLAVYYMGYLGALWLWDRRTAGRPSRAGPSNRSLARLAAAALIVAVAIVVVAGAVQTILLEEFPGLSWFVMRIAVAVPFTIGWWTLAGDDRKSAIAGGIVLAFLLATYSHYLGPIGLPSEPARVFAEHSPPADVHWLGYRELFMMMLPLTAVVAIVGYVAASRWLGAGMRAERPSSRTVMLTAAAAGASIAVLGAVTAPHLGPEANEVTVTSVGPGLVAGNDTAVAASSPGILRMTVANRNTHRTPLPPNDRIQLHAIIPAASGQTYDIRATEPVIADPAGRFTTWYGVGFGEWHDGRSGIGLARMPPTRSDVVAFALADVRADGRLVATRVPVQVNATRGDNPRLEMHVDEMRSQGVGALHVTWPDFEAGDSDESKNARYLFGGGLLLILLGLTFAAAWRQRHLLTAR